MLIWNPHFGTLANSIIILAVMGWLCLLWYRYRSRYTVRKTIQLLAPKLLCSLLVVIALMDPAWRDSRPTGDSQKVAVIIDISTSMDVVDNGSASRAERAKQIRDEMVKDLRGLASVENYRFDIDILAPDATPATGTRNTDLGRTIVALSERPDLADCKAIVLLTDGGDETIRSERLPNIPINIIGIGTDPTSWDDLEIVKAVTPEEVELKTPFKVSAEILVHAASDDFITKAKSIVVQIEKQIDGVYKKFNSVKIDPRKNNGLVEFNIPGEAIAGLYQYRMSVPGIDGEITDLNNTREFIVEVREKSINVLLYGNLFDQNFSRLRRQFADDKTIKLTAVYRKSADVIRVSGNRQEGDQVLAKGFPKDEEVLGLYTIIILGSFPANVIPSASHAALNKYVDGGGNLVLLGGPKSFDKGGYYSTAIAPLLPWKASRSAKGISSGLFPVMVPPEGANHPLSSATATLLSNVSSPVFYSINNVGKRRSGALSLLNASVGSNVVPIVALQPYGKGQVLGVASDTIWRWGRMDGDIVVAYHQFWRDTIRYLSGEIEGGRFLNIKWDRKRYRSSEEAIVDIGIVGRYAEGALNLTGTVKHDGASVNLPIVLKEGSDFQTRVFFPKPGDYTITVEATLAGEPLDSYTRTIRVGSSVSEAADLAVDHPFLENLATRSAGSYGREDDHEALMERLETLLLTSGDPHDTPLVHKPAIFNLPIYIILLMAVLLWEWILRRRMNII